MRLHYNLVIWSDHLVCLKNFAYVGNKDLTTGNAIYFKCEDPDFDRQRFMLKGSWFADKVLISILEKILEWKEDKSFQWYTQNSCF